MTEPDAEFTYMTLPKYIDRLRSDNQKGDPAEVILYQINGVNKYLTLMNRANGGIYPFMYSFKKKAVYNFQEQAPLFLFQGKNRIEKNIKLMGDLGEFNVECIRA